MGNLFCCTTSSQPRKKPATPPSQSPTTATRANPKPRARPKAKAKPNPYAPRGGAAASSPSTVRVLDGVVPHHPRLRVTDKYHLGRELGRGEFGVTRLATDRGAARERLACKSIPKARLRTAVDVADVRREVAIMASLPDHPALVRMRAAYEDEEAVHIVMELCDGGELFDRIVARGRYTERAAAAAARTVAEIVRACHRRRRLRASEPDGADDQHQPPREDRRVTGAASSVSERRAGRNEDLHHGELRRIPASRQQQQHPRAGSSFPAFPLDLGRRMVSSGGSGFTFPVIIGDGRTAERGDGDGGVERGRRPRADGDEERRTAGRTAPLRSSSIGRSTTSLVTGEEKGIDYV